MRRIALLATPLLLAQAAPPPPGAPVTPNMGPVQGEGTLTDRDGNAIGTWRVEAVLKGGQFTGSGSVTIKGQTVAMPLRARSSYLENQRCVFDMQQGRARAEIAGPCTAKGIGGFLNAFIPTGEVYSVSGYAKGSLRFAAPARAPATGVLPTARLTCAWMERIGGNVPGAGASTYELRFSNMGYLQLSPAGTYTTAHTSGRFVREGGTIRLTSGQFAGAVGRLEPDKSGQPAVYFERDENKRPNGVHIVDPARTSCTVKR